MKDGDRYRFWYRTDDRYETNLMLSAYAESDVGICWEKLVVGLIDHLRPDGACR